MRTPYKYVKKVSDSLAVLSAAKSNMASIPSTVGAALAGCMFSVGLSAVLGFQTFLYFQIFPSDQLRYKLLVAWIWLTDTTHTILICVAVWEFAISHYGDRAAIDTIFPSLAALVAITAIITISVNVFYGWRIHKMSRQNWWITGPIAFLSIARVGLAFTTSTEMILSKTFTNFNDNFKLLLTCGLAVSAATDILVSAARYYYLRNLKQGYMMTQEVVDGIVIFTLNDGALTCAVVIACIICLLNMPRNFVWLGIYFTIAKFYSNSVLATLNLRNWYRHRPVRPMPLGIAMTRPPGVTGTNSIKAPSVAVDKRSPPSDEGHTRMEVFVDHQVEYNVGDFVRGNLDHDDRSDGKLMEIP
ncbi:hypothetical protein FB45DRAFT_311425 [Roridomyces roridus]|uniref:DUF6534 domain-containing protein n=1 Tax=Roridomyces roridus TaxID=1738132 RepID=A0AAD7B5V7_9AGAR|nr:hypothetical protein FB45DRAFT_311425 [Roridomyces roridus]